MSLARLTKSGPCITHGDAGKIAFNAGGKYRQVGMRETLGQNLQADRLAGSGRRTTTIGERKRQKSIAARAPAGKNFFILIRPLHHARSLTDVTGTKTRQTTNAFANVSAQKG